MTESKKMEKKVNKRILLLRMLTWFNDGMMSGEVTKKLGFYRQKLYPHRKELEKSGLIRRLNRTHGGIHYEVTNEGKKFLADGLSFLSGSIRLHYVFYSYPIIKDAEIPVDKVVPVLNRWNQYIKRNPKCTVTKTTRNLIVKVMSLFGSDSYELINQAKNIADETIKEYKDAYGIEVGNGELVQKPHFAIAIQDENLKKLAKSITFSNEYGSMDESEKYGEIDYNSAEHADAAIKLPIFIRKTSDQLLNLESHLIKQTEIMDKFSAQLELHLQVLHEMSETLKEIRESVRK